MDSSPPSRLTSLQRDLVEAFFAREQRFFLTGEGALCGYYLGHRDTDDLDLFTPPGPDLEDADRVLAEAAIACGATMQRLQEYRDFHRSIARRGEEECVVDLVVDRAPMVDPEKRVFGAVRVDSLREIAANKICTLLSRCEIRDLVDLRAILETGIDLSGAFDDALKKELGADPAMLAFILEKLHIGSEAELPGRLDPWVLDQFRRDLILRLRALAFERASRR